MCWTGKDDKVMIANADIPVFKIAKVSPHDGKVYPYFQSSSLEYRENTTYECDANGFMFRFEVSTYRDNEYVVHKAIHSYSTENIRLFAAHDCPSVYIGTYKTTPQSHDVIARPQYYKSDSVALMLCTIPKGTRYAVNSVGEIVSDVIAVERIIKNPFTRNKDDSLSKRSVERTNKILNDWEKGELWIIKKKIGMIEIETKYSIETMSDTKRLN